MRLILYQEYPAPKLELDVPYDSTLEEALRKLNHYRSPENQIRYVYNKHGKIMHPSIKIKGELAVYSYVVG